MDGSRAMGLPAKYLLEQIERARRFQAQNDNWSIKSVDGGSYFIAEETLTNGAHVICDSSLKHLMDRLESDQ